MCLLLYLTKVLSDVLLHLLTVCYAIPFLAMRLEVSIESLLDAMTDKHKQSVIANEYQNCEQEAHELLSCIIAYNTLSCLKSSDDVGDDENAKDPLVKVSGNPFPPMGYRENINLHTFTGL